MSEFEKYYQSGDIAEDYDALRFAGKGGAFIDQVEQESVIQGLLPPESGRILEIGCGTGRCTSTLLQRGYRVTSVDPSEEMLMRARERMANLKQADRERSEFLMGNGFDLGNVPGEFACGLSLRVFIHLSLENAGKMLQQVHGKISPGGRFCFDTLNPWSPNLVILPINLFQDTFSKATFLSPRKLAATIESSGFNIVGIRRHFVVPQFLFRKMKFGLPTLIKVNSRFEKIVPGLSGHYFWTIEKRN